MVSTWQAMPATSEGVKMILANSTLSCSRTEGRPVHSAFLEQITVMLYQTGNSCIRQSRIVPFEISISGIPQISTKIDVGYGTKCSHPSAGSVFVL
jgi:hypothetical protein